jgi:hypothetical protein
MRLGQGGALNMGLEKRETDSLSECGLCKAFSDAQKHVGKKKRVLVYTPFYDTEMKLGLCTPCVEHAREADKGMQDSMDIG